MTTVKNTAYQTMKTLPVAETENQSTVSRIQENGITNLNSSISGQSARGRAGSRRRPRPRRAHLGSRGSSRSGIPPRGPDVQQEAALCQETSQRVTTVRSRQHHAARPQHHDCEPPAAKENQRRRRQPVRPGAHRAPTLGTPLPRRAKAVSPRSPRDAGRRARGRPDVRTGRRGGRPQDRARRRPPCPPRRDRSRSPPGKELHGTDSFVACD